VSLIPSHVRHLRTAGDFADLLANSDVGDVVCALEQKGAVGEPADVLLYIRYYDHVLRGGERHPLVPGCAWLYRTERFILLSAESPIVLGPALVVPDLGRSGESHGPGTGDALSQRDPARARWAREALTRHSELRRTSFRLARL
jgi:hypothetical protein